MYSTINPQNVIKIVGSSFEKIKIFYFFSCELTLILRVGGKLKKTARDIYKRTPDIEFEQGRSIGLGAKLGDGYTEN